MKLKGKHSEQLISTDKRSSQQKPIECKFSACATISTTIFLIELIISVN